jgi:hypothetical protein
MTQRQDSKRIVGVASAIVIVVVWLILVLPLFFGRHAAPKAEATANPSDKPPANAINPATKPTSGAMGAKEEDIISWLAPLLNPAKDTTPFENITPDVRKMLLREAKEQEVRQFQIAIKALDELREFSDKLTARRTLLARKQGFVSGVTSGPARTLWEDVASRSASDGRSDQYRQTFQSAIARLDEVESLGFQQVDDPRLDTRNEMAQAHDALNWVEQQRTAVCDGQRDLDRVEFTLWIKASVVPAKIPAIPAVPYQQTFANVNVDEQLRTVLSVGERLAEVREQTMQFLQTLPNVNGRVQSFLAEPDYADDPVGPQWVKVSLPTAAFLAEFHKHEQAVEAAEYRIRADSHYTDSQVMPPVVEADKWAKKAAMQSQQRQDAVTAVMSSISAAPVFNGTLMIQTADGRPVAPSRKEVARIAARRRVEGRHSYAMSFNGSANKFNWAVADLLEPYISYEYWWRWATDVDWYRGSDARLDPEKFPEDAAATKKLWKEFRHVVDSEERLTPQCIRVALSGRNTHLSVRNGAAEGISADQIWTYWESNFLSSEKAKSVGYRPPPPPDPQTARLLDAIEGPATLNFPWQE